MLLWTLGCMSLFELVFSFSSDIYSAIPLLAIYLEETILSKDKCTPVSIAALFTIAKTWKPPICPLTNKWIKKMWYIYTTELYSAKIEEWNNAICSNMDGPRDYHTKWNKSDKDKYMIPLVCGMIQTNLFSKHKQTHRCWKQAYGYERGKVGGRH